jgi:hypothetical protein
VSARVLRVRSDGEGHHLSVEIEVVRTGALVIEPSVDDVPADIRDALTVWLTGAQS